MSRTLRFGLLGTDECVGGGAREKEPDEVDGGGRRFGRGERDGGGIRLDGGGGTGLRRGGARAPPDARWAEFMAGKEGGGRESSSLKLGMEGDEVYADVARGVVGDGGEDCFFSDGGGGGGMAFLSSSSLVLVASFVSLLSF